METSQPATYPDLAGKTAFITGGGSGIGAAFTRAFALQGSRVAFIDIAEESSRALGDELGVVGASKPLFLRCDIRDIEALRAAVEQARRQFGDASVLINNAANDDRHSFDSVTPEYWDERISVNLRHMFFTAQAIAPQMKRAGGGSIINMGSIVWRLKGNGLPAYSACKAGVHGLTRAMATEYGPSGIRVNTISPGAVWTERQVRLWLTPEFERQVMAGQTLRTRILPEDIANMALFLASDAGAKCSAQDFVVDGGWS
jgi:NAD(P)-dependent dehydrogenase (short-subunit alcohol dehydrogenase family)